MIQSVAGSYRDVVALFPITHLDFETLYQMFVNVLAAVTDVGFDTVATSVDNASCNRKFYVEALCHGILQTSIKHLYKSGNRIFLIFDPVHNFKNIYNSFEKRGTLLYPDFYGSGQVFEASFDHVRELYNLELGKPAKIAHKLTEKVLKHRESECVSCRLFLS